MASVLAAIGRTLIEFEMDLDTGHCTERRRVEAREKIDYACWDAGRRRLYVASSDGRPGVPGTRNFIQSWPLDADWFASKATDADADVDCHALRSRALHVTTDREAQHLLLTFNNPSRVEVWRLDRSGKVLNERISSDGEQAGVFAHQTGLSADGRTAAVVSRGNDATGMRPEDPGCIHLFDYRNGTLTLSRRIAPHQGFGFGPRNIVFHPSRPWVYVSLERQNKVCMFRLDATDPDAEAAFECDLLINPENVRDRQLGGAIEMHPSGRFVYVANRADLETDGATPTFAGGENSLAVFEIDQETGEPRLLEHVDTQGFYPRTFTIDAAASRVMVANGKPMKVLDGNTTVDVSAGLALFRVADDGRLTFIGSHAVETGTGSLFWAAMMPTV